MKHGYGFVPIFKRLNYFREHTVIRVLDFSEKPQSADVDVGIKRHATYLVPPIDNKWSKTNPAPTQIEVHEAIPDFNSAHHAIYMKVESSKPGIAPHSVAMYEYDTKGELITFDYTGGTNPSSFFVTLKFMKKIEMAIKGTLKEAGEPINHSHFPLTSWSVKRVFVSIALPFWKFFRYLQRVFSRNR